MSVMYICVMLICNISMLCVMYLNGLYIRSICVKLKGTPPCNGVMMTTIGVMLCIEKN